MTTKINNEHKKVYVPNSTDRGNVIRNVPHLRFPEFEGEWEDFLINDVCSEFKSGKNIKADSISESGEYPVYGGNGLRGYTSSYNHEGLYVLIGRQGALCGNVRSVHGKTFITEHAIAVAGNEISNTSFLHYLFVKMNLGQYSDQSAQPGLAVNKLLKIKVVLPSVSEQTKIARFLSLLDERITTQNKIIDKLQSLIRGIRNDVFGKFRKSVGVNAMVGDVLSYEQPQPYIVEDTEYTAEGIPVLTANKAFVLGYTSETDGIYDKGDCIIFDDFTLDCKYVDFPFKVKSSAIKILTVKDKELLRYTFEFMKYLDLSTDEHKRHYIAETQNQELFLPTAQVVRTIAHAFSALSSRMKTVTKQRNMFELQKQYLLRQMFI